MANQDIEQENKALEEKKKRLEEIRNFYKPLDKQDLANHALKYSKIRIDKEHDIRQKRKQEILAERIRREKLPTFGYVRSSVEIGSPARDKLDVLREPG